MVWTLDHPKPRNLWLGVVLGLHPGDLVLTWRPLHPGSRQPVLKDLRAGSRECGL